VMTGGSRQKKRVGVDGAVSDYPSGLGSARREGFVRDG